MVFSRVMTLLKLGAFGLVDSECSLELFAPLRTGCLEGLDPPSQTRAFGFPFLRIHL
jgi:hypothetical protein